MKTPSRGRWIVVLVVLAILLVIARCTGSDDAATPPVATTHDAPVSTTEPGPDPAPTSAGATPAPPSSSGSTSTSTPTSATAAPTTTAAPAAGPVATTRWVLGGIPVKGRAPKTGYERAQFGPAWTDDVDVAFGHNGCDTRNDILRRDLTATTLRPGTRDCVVLSGVLDDPYTGKRIAFTRGATTSSAVQIDHVVALSDAWQKGAQQIGPTRRRMFANDPLNLLAVDGPANARKGDGDAATWLPRNKAFRCRYVALQTHVKARYDLWMTAAEKDAISRVLAGCTDAQVGTIP